MARRSRRPGSWEGSQAEGAAGLTLEAGWAWVFKAREEASVAEQCTLRGGEGRGGEGRTGWQGPRHLQGGSGVEFHLQRM